MSSQAEISEEVIYSVEGECPVCEAQTQFTARHGWYRDHLTCANCHSLPRERALALVMQRRFPNWRDLRIHESYPGSRGLSLKLRNECRQYTGSRFYPGQEPGAMVGDIRNENLETQTFADRSFDLVITIDVLSYANDPEKSVKRIARTLDVGGAYLFTVPTYKGKLSSERRAAYKPDGSIEYMKPAEHHHSHPNAGGLVTFHYGYDLPQLVSRWTGLCVEATRFEDPHHGIIGEFTDVYSAARLQPN